MTAVWRRAVWGASLLAVAGAAHALVNSRSLRHLQPGPHLPRPGRVSVLVPARDEEARIGDLLADLAAQRDVPDLEVLVLDDDSGDDTGVIVAAAAGRDTRVRLISSRQTPPPGWLGKPYACHRLAQSATGDTLVFLDADVRLAPDAIAAAVAELDTADLISAWPRQLAATHLARMLQPLQQWSWLTTLPLRRAAASHRESLAAANGQFLVFTRTGYQSCGGHAAVAGEVIEDVALARAVKRAGLRADIVDAAPVAECLMYDDDRALFAGYTKSLWRAFGGPTRGLALTALLAAGYLLPIGYAIWGRHPVTRLVGSVGYGAAVVNRVITARQTGSAALPAAAEHPVALVGLFVMTAVSVRRHRQGTLRWRGRPVHTTAR